MKIAHISDTHNYHNDIKIPKCDMIIHSGDIDTHSVSSFMQFVNWFAFLPIKYKIFVAGNHDSFCEKASRLVKSICEEHNIMYLENDLVEIEGLKIYGSPITPKFYNWAFMKERGADIAKVWNKIPEGIDILVTHGPPYGIMDIGYGEVHGGCEDLLARVKEIKPKYHLFGHFHKGYGTITQDGITFINSAIVNDDYNIVREPHIFEINK